MILHKTENESIIYIFSYYIDFVLGIVSFIFFLSRGSPYLEVRQTGVKHQVK